MQRFEWRWGRFDGMDSVNSAFHWFENIKPHGSPDLLVFSTWIRDKINDDLKADSFGGHDFLRFPVESGSNLFNSKFIITNDVKYNEFRMVNPNKNITILFGDGDDFVFPMKIMVK